MYSCHEGFQLVGVEKTYCQASGRWSGSAEVFKCRLFKEIILFSAGIQPSCKEFDAQSVSPYYCGQPPRYGGGGATALHCIPTTLKKSKMSNERDPHSLVSSLQLAPTTPSPFPPNIARITTILPFLSESFLSQ